MIYTLDTNVLVYAADESFPLHLTACAIRDRAVAEQHKVRLCYSVLLEFFAIVTDPKRVDNPLSPAQAWQEVETYLSTFEVLYPDERTFAELKKLVDQYQIKHQMIFDVLIVALMVQYGVTGIYTADRGDFARFSEINVLPWPTTN